MTDYAGPILGAVGAVVGFYIGGPQGAMYGWSIGMTVGGAYATSQQVIPGPKIGDIQKQTAQEGGFRPIIYGRSLPLMGNVIADSEPVIVPGKVSSGKGGPKQQAGESAFRTYAVGFCEGETTLLQAWRSGILVFDAEDPSMAAENAKFLGYATWHSGSFEQMPDPDLEAIYGAGNTPFFRGTSYLALAGEDVTDQRGAWSQWQVRVFRGAAKRVTTPPYPLLAIDDLGTQASIHAMRDIESFIDHLEEEATFSGGQFRDVLQVYSNHPPDEFDTEATFTGGSLEVLLEVYSNNPPDEFDTAATFTSGTLKETLIVYSNNPPDEFDTSATFTGGSFS